jgi:hypothetical protein
MTQWWNNIMKLHIKTEDIVDLWANQWKWKHYIFQSWIPVSPSILMCILFNKSTFNFILLNL